jgi:deoxyribonuclease V
MGKESRMKDCNWPGDLSEARSIQEVLTREVRLTPLETDIETVAGVDAAFHERRTVAAICVFSFPALELIEEFFAVSETDFPYIPGYLSFREGPAILSAFEKMDALPDIIIFDGQGIAHPKRLGIASHMGVILDRPTIGCAKSRLVGNYKEPGARRGSWSYIYFKGEPVGKVLRTKEGVKPLFVSPGHMITINEAADMVLRCVSSYRLPDPIRRADNLSKKIKREMVKK